MHRLYSITLTVVVVANIAVGLAVRPASSQSSSLSDISQTVFDCMKRNTDGIGGWIVYQGGSSGEIQVYAAGAGQVGEVSYSLDANRQTLNVSYVRGPAPFTQIWNGLTSTANKCKKGEYQ